jgi:hypothetical protein
MGKIYLIINNNGQYKIGHTKRSPIERLNELQTGNAEPLTLNKTFETKRAKEIEKILHRRYQIYHTSGEWFQLPPEEPQKFNETCKEIEKILNYLEANKI